MKNDKRTWLLAVGKGEERAALPERWIEERPELLKVWPVAGHDIPNEISRNDHVLYYAAGKSKLIAAGRAQGPVVRSEMALPVTIYLVAPVIKFAPDLEALGKPTSEIRGGRAFELTDAQYRAGLDAFGSAVWRKYESS